MEQKQIKNIVKNNLHIILAIFFLLFSITIRYYFINNCMWHTDSIALQRAAEASIQDFRLHSAASGRYAMVFVTSAVYFFFHHLLGHATAYHASFFSTIMTGSFAVMFFYLFVRRWLNSNFIAISSALIFSLNPIFFANTTYPKSHGFSMFFVMLAFWLLVKGMQTKKIRLLIISSFSLGAAFFTRDLNITLIIPYGLMFYYYLVNKDWVFSKEKKNIIKKNERLKFILGTVMPLFITVCIYLPVQWHFITDYQKIIPILGHTTILIGWQYQLKLYFGYFLICFGSLGGVLFLLGAIRLFAKKIWCGAAVLFSWIAFYLIFLIQGNVDAPRYLTPILGPISIIMGQGLLVISSLKITNYLNKGKKEKKKNHINHKEIKEKRLEKNVMKGISIMLLILFCASMFFYITPLLNDRNERCYLKKFSDWLSENIEENAVVSTGDINVFMNYYHPEIKRMGHPGWGIKNINKIYGEVDLYLLKDIPVYFTSTAFAYDLDDLGQKIMFERYNVTIIGTKVGEDWHRQSILDGRQKITLMKLDFW